MGATAGVSDLGRVEASPRIKRGRAPAGPAVSPLTSPSRREPVPPRLSHFFLWAGSATPSSPPVKITGKRLVTPEPKLRRFLVTAAHAENAAATRYNPGPITIGPGIRDAPNRKPALHHGKKQERREWLPLGVGWRTLATIAFCVLSMQRFSVPDAAHAPQLPCLESDLGQGSQCQSEECSAAQWAWRHQLAFRKQT